MSLKHIFSILIPVLSLLAFDIKAQENSPAARGMRDIERLLERAEYYLERNNDSCTLAALEAEKLSLAYGFVQQRAKALDITGSFYIQRERYRNAAESYNNLIRALAAEPDTGLMAHAHNQLGQCYMSLSVYDEALGMFFRAVELSMEANDSLQLPVAYYNMGILYSLVKDYNEAMVNLRSSLEIFRNTENSEYEARTLHQIGKIYTAQDNFEDALGYFLAAQKLIQGNGNNTEVADIYLSLGMLYEHQSVDRSMEYLSEALITYKSTAYQLGMGRAYYGLGRLEVLRNNYRAAIDNFSRSLEIFSRIEAVGDQAECHRHLSNVYALEGEMTNAYNEMNLYVEFADSLMGERIAENIAEKEILHRSYLKDIEIEGLQMERTSVLKAIGRKNLSLLAIISMTALVIAVTIYYTRILRRANNNLRLEVEERVKAEKELLQVKNSLEERVTERTFELQQAKIKAEESDKLKSAFLANLSHEIRTPLNIITGYSGLMLKDDLSEQKKKEYNELISKNTKLLLNIIEDLIDTSKVESGTLQIAQKKVNVEDIIDQLEIPLSEIIVNKGRQNLKIIRDQLSLKNTSLYTDPVRVQQIMLHLLDNAVKFTEEGTIRYGCNENNDSLIFYVSDTGSGIPDEYRDVIFEKFRQLDETSKRKYGGTGLGLFFARRIAVMLGGKVWFVSKKEGGSVFYFSLPLK